MIGEGQTVCVRLTMDQFKWLRAQGERLDRPMSWVIRTLISERMKTKTGREQRVEERPAPR